MLAIQIDNPTIENSLKSKFKDVENIKDYIYKLILEDFEDKQLLESIELSHKKDFVQRDDVFKVLDNI